MANTVRLVAGADDADEWPSDLYPGRWIWTVEPFTIAAGGDGDVQEFDLVIEDPADADYVFDVYGGWDAPVDAATITGGFTFDSAAPTIFDWFGVWRVPKTTYNGWGYTFPTGGAYDGAWDGPFEVDETLELLEGPPALGASEITDRRIGVEVYESDGFTHVGNLTSDRKRSWRDAGKEPGSFSFEIPVGGTDEAHCQPDRIVRFVLDGVRRFTGVIETVRKVSADPTQRNAGKVIAVTGRDAIVVLDDAVVQPELGLGVVSPDTRHMSFAALDYVEDTWMDATELKQQSDTADPWSRSPRGWDKVDPEAFWIGPSGWATPPTDPGIQHARSPLFEIPAGEGGEYRTFFAADDAARVQIDGGDVHEARGVGLWGETHTFDITLDEGMHLCAAEVENFERPDPMLNVAGFILCIRKILAGGKAFGPVVLRTNSDWRLRAYYSPPPGFTPGGILKTFVEEAQAAGHFPTLALGFTELVDSAGVTWPDKVDEAFAVSTSLLDVAMFLVEEGLCDLAIDPDSFTLHAYVQRGVDHGLTPDDGEETVTVTVGTNVGLLAHTKRKRGKNRVLAMTPEGRWIEEQDDDAVDDHGPKTGAMRLGNAASDPSARRQIQAWLRDQAGSTESITDLRVEGLSYPELTPCNVVVAPDYDGTNVDHRVVALAVTEDAGGPIITPELEVA